MMIVVTFMIFILLIELCEFAYKKTSYYKKYNEQNLRLHNVPGDLEIVNIGSGPVYYGIDYRYCDKNGYNLATAPQNFLYGFRLLKYFSDRLVKKATVIITVMVPMSFGYNTDIYRKGYSDKYYGILPSKEIDGFSWIRKWVIRHPLTVQAINKIKNKLVPQKKKSSSSSKSVVQTWIDEFGLKNLRDANQTERHVSTFEEKISLLEEMVIYIRGNGWNPVIVIPPIPHQTRENISKEFLNEFVYKNLEELISRVGEIAILDYYDDERFDESLFRNDIFLNEKGAKVFSEILFRDVEIGKKVK